MNSFEIQFACDTYLEFVSILDKQKFSYFSGASEIAHLESYEKCRLQNDNANFSIGFSPLNNKTWV